MTEAEIKNLASTAATEALEKFLLVLGVNVSTPDSKLELQQDFAHLRRERLAMRAAGKQIVATLTGAAVMGVVTAVGYYITHGPH